MTTKQHQAAELGEQAGRNAASWFEPEDFEDPQAVLISLMTDIDPQVMDAFRPPNLSGEFADSTTPYSLAVDLEIDDPDDLELDGGLLEACCDAWEEAASLAYWALIQAKLHRYLADRCESNLEDALS